MEIKGIHHVSAITKYAQENHDFYTNVLGMRLVKKTVNQDDPSMYHLFYADAEGSAGTDFTFFEIPMLGNTYEGTNSISTTTLRVPDDEAIDFWEDRLHSEGLEVDPVTERFGRRMLFFRDPEGQRLGLVSDENNEGIAPGVRWETSEIPASKAIQGLGPVYFTVPHLEPTAQVLTETLGFTQLDNESDIYRFQAGKGGTGGEIHVIADASLPKERPGQGSVHHAAFRVKDREELEQWVERVQDAGLVNSGVVDRHYFQSLYFREPNHILIELATDGPGFDVDEPMDSLGEALSLPPFLENRREEIEENLKPIRQQKN
ncbi:ring-cleaving dioxygenase [Salimicrobium humidisoli]|uniref:Ring-cleaving dioxygenase n=1 Tax=Salimicrobium humidisoli TaxID=2029857 RepID=A0ABX4HW14_9BACI|nr:ring-cleaving dioxygenase [Salimicrobium humidisoli]PBB07125.1 ring-cleaving dioxygenase [Salimicrobium humidisoli]